jgi:hypothetical protein
MSYYLLLDDVRSVEDVKKYTKLPNIPDDQWKIVRSYENFVKHIRKNGIPLFVSYDHDLGNEHYNDFEPDGSINYKKYKEPTGYDCCKFLIEFCKDNKQPHPPAAIHTMNPVGRQNIINIITEYNYLVA